MTVKGIVKNGIITPVEKVDLKENQEVIIHLIEEEPNQFINTDLDTFLNSPVDHEKFNSLCQQIEQEWQGQNKNMSYTQQDIDENTF